MTKDELITEVSLSINWERIIYYLEYKLDVEINYDSYTFIDIEETISEMILEAIEDEHDFILKQ